MSSVFLEYVKEQMWTRRYAKRTIETYLYWIKAYINFNGKVHPNQCHDKEVESFLSYLSNSANMAPKSQAVALNALSYLYKHILNKPLSLDLNFNKSLIHTKLPTVLTASEIKQLFKYIPSQHLLASQLMYGSGLRLMEVVRLRVQDIDFDYRSIQVWFGKGGKHRRVTLAEEVIPTLKRQIALVENYFYKDVTSDNYYGVYMPFALRKKYPSAPFVLLNGHTFA